MQNGVSRRAMIGVGLAFAAAVAAACTSAIRSGPGAPSIAGTGPDTAVGTRAAGTPSTVSRSTAAPATTAARPASSTAAPPTSTSRPAPASTASSTSRTNTAAATTTSRAAGAPAVQVASGPTDRDQLALTFHGAGDIGLARQILQIAGQHKALITVMAVGTWLAQYPAISREIVSAGHEVGNHTWSHQDINSLGASDVTDEIVRCRDLLRSQINTPGRYFRQSQSETANSLVRKEAGAAGYGTCLSYDLDSMDWTDPGASAIRANLRSAKAGSIVSMHLGHQGTVDALPGILHDLTARHLTPVTVSTLLRA